MAKRTSQPPVTAEVPCIYADDVANLSSSAGVLKFYLTRDDPPPEGEPASISRTVAQIVMPKGKLMELVIFFQQSLGELERKGSLYDDKVLRERLRAIGIPATDASGDE
jgi:hypothetical protein